MKKFSISLITIILCSFLLTCFNGCGDNSKLKTVNGKTAKQVYENICTTIEQAKNDFSYTIDYSANEILVSQNSAPLTNRKFTSTLQKKNDNYVYTTILDIKSISLEKSTLYTKKTNTFFNQTLYRLTEQTFNGQPFTSKIKGEYSFAHSLIILGKDDAEFINPIYPFAKSELNDVRFSNLNSELYFELTITGDTAKTFAKNILLNTNVTTSSYTCSDVSYKFYVDNDANFTHALVSFFVECSLNNVDYKYEYQGTINLFDIGSTSVSIPENADSYTHK